MSAFLAKTDDYTYKLADNFLDAMTNGEHSKSLKEAGPAGEEEELISEEEKNDMEVRAAATAAGIEYRCSLLK